jgi:HYDIN/CFA65/VesB family protein
MKTITGLTRSTLGALALVTLLVAPLGCAGVDEEGELVGEVAQAAVPQPSLVNSPTTLAFGTIPVGTMSSLTVTLTNVGAGDASSINVAVPPDPYRVLHNPPTYLDANGGSSNVMEVTFNPATTGSFSREIVLSYAGPASGGATAPPLYSLTIRATGTAN